MLKRIRGPQPTKLHYHQTAVDGVVFCWHKCRSAILSPGFWIGTTLGFPVEHYIWDHIWPFYLITKWMGL